MATLTAQQIFEQAKPRFEIVELNGWGQIGIRSCPEVKRSERLASMFDANGNQIPAKRHRQRVYRIIDQITDADGKPIFSEEDAEALGELDGPRLDDLSAAISRFNGEEEKNELAGSTESSEG